MFICIKQMRIEYTKTQVQMNPNICPKKKFKKGRRRLVTQMDPNFSKIFLPKKIKIFQNLINQGNGQIFIFHLSHILSLKRRLVMVTFLIFTFCFFVFNHSSKSEAQNLQEFKYMKWTGPKRHLKFQNSENFTKYISHFKILVSKDLCTKQIMWRISQDKI